MSPRHSKHEANRQKFKSQLGAAGQQVEVRLAPEAPETTLAPNQSEQDPDWQSSANSHAMEEVWPAGFRLDENAEGQIKRLKDTTTVQHRNRSAPLPPEQVKLGEDYEVLTLLGQGGMGFVYKVKDKRKNQTVAVKVVRPELATDERALKRFEQEAEAAMGLLHPNLVPVYGQGMTEAGAPYLVMEYQEGTPLDKVLKQETRIDSERAVDIFMQICDALEHAHAKGIVHRDLKPSNVVLTKTKGNKDLVRIVDFGIAKVLASPESRETFDLTHTGDLFGSPSYMSPEQCMGYRLDPRSDVYSLGCVMYEVLSGRPPFISDNPVQTIVKHLSDVPQRLVGSQSDYKDIPPTLESLVLRCLEKDPRNRYQSMAQLRTDLSNIQTGEKPVYFERVRQGPAIQVPMVVTAAVVIVIDLICLSAALDQHDQSIQSLAEANNVVETTALISKYFTDAADDLRGYSASNNPLFIDRYNSTESQIVRELTRLKDFYPNDAVYQANVGLVDKRLSEDLRYLKSCKEMIETSAIRDRADQLAKPTATSKRVNDEAKPDAMERELLSKTNQLNDDMLGVTQGARALIKRAPLGLSRALLAIEILALMFFNMLLVFNLGKSQAAERARDIWKRHTRE
jgi:serine/threonine protein kinase